MTDLNLAYGFSDDDNYQQQPQQRKEKKENYQQQPPQQIQQPPQQISPPPQQQLDPYVNQQKYKQTSYSYSFWDRMVMSRNDVIKLAIFSLVIVLGISLDRISTHYITKYLSDNIFTNIQEFLIRLCYPIIIFIFLWIIKSL